MTAEPHGFVTRVIHWVSAALIGYGYLKGLDSVSQLADPAVLRFEVFFALGLCVLFVGRFAWTKYVAGPTRLPNEAPKWEHQLSRAVHLGLYASVFGIVLSGLGIALAYSTPLISGIVVAGLVGLHEFFLIVLPALLCCHVAGALWHRLVRRDGVMESMTGKLGQSRIGARNTSLRDQSIV